MNNETQVNTEEERTPSRFEIVVSTGWDEVVYENVSAFQVEDRLLKFVDGESTYLIPVCDATSYVKITPFYEEEKRIVQVP